MAFLCPVRMRRDKKKATNANIERDLPIPGVGMGLNHGMGRITGSSSIETLVRVGIEKEHGLSPDSKMCVLHDFTPCVDDELEVKRGQIVNILYRENDWVYVIGQDTRQEGFIPYSYCAPYNTQLADLAITKKKLPREQNTANCASDLATDTMPLLGGVGSGGENKLEIIDEVVTTTGGNTVTPTGVGGNGTLKNSEVSLSSDTECTPFHKEPSGRYIVLYTFIARDENDLSVERGEFVTVLNRDDADWFWIVRSDGQEGFIPAAFVFPAESVLQTQQKMLNACGGVAPDASTGNANNNGVGNVGGAAGAGTNASTGAGLPHAAKSALGAELTAANLNNNLTALSQTLTAVNSLDTNACLQQSQQQQQLGLAADDLRYHHGTELVMLYDYKAQAPDDLSVRRGDWIYADLNNQTVDGWLWAYAPKTRKYGFIPKAYARPPAMTSL